MAIMMNCVQDWTYDIFLEDINTYTAFPIKGGSLQSKCFFERAVHERSQDICKRLRKEVA